MASGTDEAIRKNNSKMEQGLDAVFQEPYNMKAFERALEHSGGRVGIPILRNLS